MPDAVAGVDGRLAVARLGAQISVPGAPAGSGRGGEPPAMRVGPRQAAEVAALADRLLVTKKVIGGGGTVSGREQTRDPRSEAINVDPATRNEAVVIPCLPGADE